MPGPRRPGRLSRWNRRGDSPTAGTPSRSTRGVDYGNEPTTLVEFTLSETADGVLLRIVESGFDAIPETRRADAFEANSGGWAKQTELVRQVPQPGAAGVTATLAAAPVFDALGDANRLRIVVRLCDGGPSSTSQVTQAVSVTRQAATKHLELLEAAGLVISSRRGRERIWTLQTRPLIDAGDYLNQLSRRWDAAIDRLRTFVED